MTPLLAPVSSPPFPIDQSVGSSLASALELAVFQHDRTQAELRAAIIACVDSLREQGMTPEGVVITMKALVMHLARSAAPGSRERTLRAADYFMVDVVEWSIEAYFRTSRPPP
nr:MetaGeneMark_Unknown Function [uncultured bacterium]